jgi:hypothetical protein
MNARYYSSDTGRFISQDTYSGNAFNPWTQHLYTYTSNNPINYVDPTGHYHVDPDGNKILPNGAYIPNRSQPTASKPSTSHISTPSGSKKSKPSAKQPKVYSNKVSGKAVKKVVQSGLGLVGFVPGLGAVADGVNALIYAVDGDYKNAGLSLLAAVPIYGDGAKLGLKAGGMVSRAVKGSRKYDNEVTIPSNRYPETSKHIHDAQKAGHPDILTIGRSGAKSRRKDSLSGLDKFPGKDLNEYPPAMFKEGGTGASVRPVSPSDNRGAGAYLGNKLRNYPDGTRVRLK